MFKLKPIMFGAAWVSLVLGSTCHASLINALSGSLLNVAAAAATALPGDVILLPPGTNVWTQSVSLSGVSLRGSGTNRTVIIDEASRANNGGQLIYLNPSPLHLTELSNLQLQGGVTNTSYNYFGTVVCNGTPLGSWRVDHVLFNGLYAKNIVTYGNSLNVIDHNTFLMRAIAVMDSGYVPNDGTGDQSYVLPPTYGVNSASVLYIENNYFTNIIGSPSGVSDGCYGARVVFRNNIVCNDFFANHGTETGGRPRSERSFEIYNNTFTYSPSTPGYPYYTFLDIRGGCGVVYSNTATGYYSLIALRDFRATDSYCGQWYPFCGADGVNPWDSNSPTLYLQGTSSAPNGSSYLSVTGAHWTTNQWVGYTVTNASSGYFSVVTSNSANVINYIGLGSGLVQSHPPMTFNTGDQFSLFRVYATLDQPGRGSGDLLADDGMTPQNNEYVINASFGVPAYPRQALEGIYFWSNSLNGTNVEASSPYPGILAGRDFYNDTPRPGYVAYQFPHPLDVIVAPPSNLTIVTNNP